MSLVPALTLWVILQNCTCPISDTLCYHPSQYRSPIICAHRDIKNITEYLATGPPQDILLSAVKGDDLNSSHPHPEFPTLAPLYLLASLNFCISIALLIITLINCSARYRTERRNRAAGFHRLLPASRRRANPPPIPRSSNPHPNPPPLSIPEYVPTLKLQLANEYIDKAASLLGVPRNTGFVARTAAHFEEMGTSTSQF